MTLSDQLNTPDDRTYITALMERVQRRATRMVIQIRHRPYSERLALLDLPSLYYRRKRGDMIRVFQVLHSIVNLDPSVFFERDTNTRTRGHPFKLKKPTATSRVRRNAFGIRVINDWNSLPASVVCAPSIGAFKARLDKHWHVYRFTIPDTD